jgi:hypothetical protein
MRQRKTTTRIAASAAIISAAAITTAGIPVAAGAATAAVHRIRQVPCTSRTFNVHYGFGREKCFEGTGLDFVRIPNVREITTGNNRGWFSFEERVVHYKIVRFAPRRTYLFSPVLRTELVAIDIA